MGILVWVIKLFNWFCEVYADEWVVQLLKQVE